MQPLLRRILDKIFFHDTVAVAAVVFVGVAAAAVVAAAVFVGVAAFAVVAIGERP